MLQRCQSHHSYRACWVRFLFSILAVGVLSSSSGCSNGPDYKQVIQQGAHAFYSVRSTSVVYAASAPLANRELEAWANPSSTLTVTG